MGRVLGASCISVAVTIASAAVVQYGGDNVERGIYGVSNDCGGEKVLEKVYFLTLILYFLPAIPETIKRQKVQIRVARMLDVG